ncbi:claudin-19 isoform X1 [Hippoglossus stenolepis]|uniref:claudin-19 isoform X1 n=1 Tax=Hippoglossus stenolepis TaxID=195615 RepID=UPI00159C153A|nr:claudin-19 isoform X1 [Hippoglossus stenolepis]XP_035010859.1 claudin-19 isoform X1 [Hippoglossus stenolepis]
MAVGLQVVAVVLGVVSWCLQSSCTSSQVWKVRSQVESLSSNQWQFEGLWMSCAATSLGSVQCNRFKTLLGLPVHLQTCRALMILSLLVGLAAIIVSVLGLKCTKIGRTSEHVKDQIALSGGVMFILSVSVTSAPRCLHPDGGVVVRSQSHPRLLRPAVRRSQVRAGHWFVSGLDLVLSRHPRRIFALLLLQEDVACTPHRAVFIQLLQDEPRTEHLPGGSGLRHQQLQSLRLKLLLPV